MHTIQVFKEKRTYSAHTIYRIIDQSLLSNKLSMNTVF